MQTIGERLEEARKKKGISIREAAEATKIRGDYLSRFENNQFDINLTELYVRGFLRTYAQFLRLPADRILNDYAALGRGEARTRQPSREIYGRMDVSIVSADERSDGSPAAEENAAPQAAARRAPVVTRRGTPLVGSSIDPALLFKFGKWAVAGLAAILVIWGGVALFSSAVSDKPPTSVATPSATSPVTAEPTVTLIALEAVQVKVTVKNPDGSSGEVLLPDTRLARGETRSVPRKGPLYLTASALENVAIEANGRRFNIRDQGLSGNSRVQISR